MPLADELKCGNRVGNFRQLTDIQGLNMSWYVTIPQLFSLQSSGKSFGGSGVAHAMFEEHCAGCFQFLGGPGPIFLEG